MEHFETLVRSILLRPDSPAILLLGHFSPQIHEAYLFDGPDHWHSSVAQFYDLPYISIKSALYPAYMGDPHAVDKYYVDPILSSPLGHELIRDILVSYFQSQICATWNALTSESSSEDAHAHGIFGGAGKRKGVPEPENELDKHNMADSDNDNDENKNKRLINEDISIPPTRMNTRPGRPFEEIAPFCVSANDLINPLPPSLFYGSGWNVHHPLSAGPGGSNALLPTAHYWHSTVPTSKIRVPLQIGAGDIAVYYIQEPIKIVGNGSAIECWVDDNHAGAKVIENAGDVKDPTPTYVFRFRHVSLLTFFFLMFQAASHRPLCEPGITFRRVRFKRRARPVCAHVQNNRYLFHVTLSFCFCLHCCACFSILSIPP